MLNAVYGIPNLDRRTRTVNRSIVMAWCLPVVGRLLSSDTMSFLVNSSLCQSHFNKSCTSILCSSKRREAEKKSKILLWELNIEFTVCARRRQSWTLAKGGVRVARIILTKQLSGLFNVHFFLPSTKCALWICLRYERRENTYSIIHAAALWFFFSAHNNGSIYLALTSIAWKMAINQSNVRGKKMRKFSKNAK